MGEGHPECPQRLDAIHDHLLSTGLVDGLSMREAPLAGLEARGIPAQPHLVGLALQAAGTAGEEVVVAAAFMDEA